MAAPGDDARTRSLTPERWQQVKNLFDAAMEREPADREAFVNEVCQGDADLRREVESLLSADAEAASRYDKPVVAGDPMIGRQLGAYKIIRRLGTGGMGAVYLAARADDQFRRLVAVKAIRTEVLDEHTRHRFENERHTLAALDHPNIVRLLDGGTTEDGMPYLVMDYVEGQPIDCYCKEHGLTIAERLGLFRTLCAAVHFAHQNLVVHRDLKPANILVTPQGIPKLMDFGIAKLLRPEYAAGPVGFTRTAAQPMTPEYASPEQIKGHPITTASDIYALGVLLYVLLAGAHPFERQTKSSYELERAICEGEVRKPSDAASPEAARQLRGDLDMIVLAAMRKEPHRRYASAEHLAEDVRRYLDGQPVAARGESVVYRAKKFVGRHQAALAASAAAVGLLAYLGVMDHLDRRRAEARFGQLRDFANYVIKDLDQAMGKGMTAARVTVNGKALEYLNGLAREAHGDAALQREAMEGYLHVADVQGNLFKSNLGDAAAATASANRALSIAEDLLRREPKDQAAKTGLYRCHQTLGDVLELAGDHAGALDHYRKALDLGVGGAVDLANLWTKVATTQSNAGDPAAALESMGKCEAILRAALDRKPADPNVRRGLAFARERSADFAMQIGELGGAEAAKQEIIAIYEQAPGARKSTVQRHNIAMAYKGLAEVQKREGKIRDALANCHKSLEISKGVRAEDSTNDLAGADMAQEYVLLIDLLQASNQRAEAHNETAHAVEFLKPLQMRAGQYHYYYLVDYVTLLVTMPFPEFSSAEERLSLARKAVEVTRDYETLDLLAQAYDLADRAGDAIAMLPPSKPGGKTAENRKKLTDNLQKFQRKEATRGRAQR